MLLLLVRRVAPVLVLVFTLAACGGGSNSSGTAPAGGTTLVTLDGSSTVFPISEAVAEEFQDDSRYERVRRYRNQRYQTLTPVLRSIFAPRHRADDPGTSVGRGPKAR